MYKQGGCHRTISTLTEIGERIWAQAYLELWKSSRFLMIGGKGSELYAKSGQNRLSDFVYQTAAEWLVLYSRATLLCAGLLGRSAYVGGNR